MIESEVKASAILVVGPAWVGDMVMAQALFKTLRARHPGVAIDVLAPKWSLPLLARMPEVRAGIEMPLGHGQFQFSVRRDLGRRLRARQYDQAIVLPRSFKSAITPFFARIPRRTGYLGELRRGLLNDIRPLDKNRLTQTVQRFVNLGLAADEDLPDPIPTPALQVDTENQRRLIDCLGLSADAAGSVTALIPGAEYGPAKQWPLEYFADLAKRRIAMGDRVWVFGSPKETALGERVAQLAGDGARNLCGQTQLVDAVDLLAACRRVVTNDSGLMHVSGAVGVPLVAIYGSSTPDYTPPLAPQAETIWLHLDCSPCFERRCPLGHTNCLRQISPDEVLVRLQRFE